MFFSLHLGNSTLHPCMPSFSVLSTCTSIQSAFESKLPFSTYTVCLQVSLGLPLQRLPSGVHVCATFGCSFAWISPQHMTNQLPMPLFFLVCNFLHICPWSYLFVDTHWAVNLQNASQALVKEDVDLSLVITFNHSSFAKAKNTSTGNLLKALWEE